jgi:hypothetical protein
MTTRNLATRPLDDRCWWQLLGVCLVDGTQRPNQTLHQLGTTSNEAEAALVVGTKYSRGASPGLAKRQV